MWQNDRFVTTVEQARTITSTYHNGQLQLYTHHVTKPEGHGGRPEYHMTSINSFAMTGNVDKCRAGVGAYRNARDWAQGQRDALIAEANTRARHGSPDMMSFTTTDHSRNTSDADARHVESDTSADELALDHDSSTRRRRKVPSSDKLGRHDVSPSRRSSKLSVVREDEQQVVNPRSRHKPSSQDKRELSPPPISHLSRTIAQKQPSSEPGRSVDLYPAHSARSVLPDTSGKINEDAKDEYRRTTRQRWCFQPMKSCYPMLNYA